MCADIVAPPFSDCKVGINPWAFDTLLDQYLATATPEQRLAANDQGLRHWPYAAARNHGVLDVTLRHRKDSEGRWYATGAFPWTSMPSALRSAITSPEPGHRVLSVDVRSSHFRVAAHASHDLALIQTLDTGDLYMELAELAGVTRQQAKVGVNIWNNGGGPDRVESTTGIADGKAFLGCCEHLFSTKYAKAGSWMIAVAQEAFDNGWADKEHAAKGVALMRREAECLELAAAWVDKTDGAFVMLPMHDGLLVSVADEHVAQSVALLVARAFAGPGAKASVVESKLSNSWDGDVAQTVGHQIRVHAMSTLSNDALAGSRAWGFASAVLSPSWESTKAPRGNAGDDTRKRQQESKDAAAWSNAHRVRAKYGSDPVDLPDNRGTSADLCRIVNDDPAFPTLAVCARTGRYVVDGKVIDSLEQWCLSHGVEFVTDRYGWYPSAPTELFTHSARKAQDLSFDPVREYLEGLTWDGVPRLATWATDYLPCADTDLHRAYGMKTMLGLVKRVLSPGCQHDTILTLVGGQGASKTRFFEAFAPGNSFDSVDLNPDDRDKVYRASRPAVVEWGEFSGLTRREQESLKDYITRRSDTVRRPYGREDQTFPRKNVFVASTNDRDFLRDSTGSRRYWPMEVTESIDIAKFLTVKDQLWAEAVHVYNQDPSAPFLNWLPPELESERVDAATEYEDEDPMVAKTADTLAKMYPSGGEVTIRMVDILDTMMVRPQDGRRVSLAVGRALRALGFTKTKTTANGIQTKAWKGTLPTSKPPGWAAPYYTSGQDS